MSLAANRQNSKNQDWEESLARRAERIGMERAVSADRENGEPSIRPFVNLVDFCPWCPGHIGTAVCPHRVFGLEDYTDQEGIITFPEWFNPLFPSELDRDENWGYHLADFCWGAEPAGDEGAPPFLILDTEIESDHRRYIISREPEILIRWLQEAYFEST